MINKKSTEVNMTTAIIEGTIQMFEKGEIGKKNICSRCRQADLATIGYYIQNGLLCGKCAEELHLVTPRPKVEVEREEVICAK